MNSRSSFKGNVMPTFKDILVLLAILAVYGIASYLDNRDAARTKVMHGCAMSRARRISCT